MRIALYKNNIILKNKLELISDSNWLNVNFANEIAEHSFLQSHKILQKFTSYISKIFNITKRLYNGPLVLACIGENHPINYY